MDRKSGSQLNNSESEQACCPETDLTDHSDGKVSVLKL